MVGFFDLNIPYHESTSHLPNKPAAKSTRLKLTIKSIHLGYSGVAYNRTIKGVMSESDRCSTSLFPLSSVLKLSPSLSSAAKLHRGLVGVPVDGPFRQYARVTVVVESSAQAAALNSGNPILKSYDVVAVRPTNQQAFEQACTGSEVDLISIDFSEKLPFRLKQHMVKAAIERGVYFEISYSALLMDVQLRRQMITSAKLLVDWTRGKNIIISSAAPSVTEIRGPYDVANLSSLLGLSMENAKAALSKNCRSLIAKALRKKHYYKEAVRVEIISSGEEFVSNENWPKDWMKWDPISSGDGDLFLDEMAKSFSVANKIAKTVKPIDFASLVDKLPSHGLQVQELIPVTEATSNSFKIDSFVNKEPTKLEKSFLDPSGAPNLLNITPSTHAQEYVSNDEKTETQTAEKFEKHKDSNGSSLHVSPLGTETFCLQSENCIERCDNLVDHREKIDFSVMGIDIISSREAVSDADNSSLPISEVVPLINTRILSNSGVALGSQDDKMKSVSTEKNLEFEQDLLPISCELINMDDGYFKEIIAVPDAITDEENKNDHIVMKEVSILTDTEVKVDLSQTLCELNGENSNLREQMDFRSTVLLPQDEINGSRGQINAISESSDEVAMEEKKETEDYAQISSPAIVLNSSSGKRKMKGRMSSQARVFLFKRLLNRTLFKRKSRKPKTQSKLL